MYMHLLVLLLTLLILAIYPCTSNTVIMYNVANPVFVVIKNVQPTYIPYIFRFIVYNVVIADEQKLETGDQLNPPGLLSQASHPSPIYMLIPTPVNQCLSFASQ